MDKIEEIFKKSNLYHRLQSQVPLGERTTFKTGGKALWVFSPQSLEEARVIWKELSFEGIHPVILGKGANVLVSDDGIDSLVLDMGGLTALGLEGGLAWSQAGLEASCFVEFTADQGLSCLEFLYAMPSSLGGAVYMNARCYDHEIADFLVKVLVVNEQGEFETILREQTLWSYKDSPFMHRPVLILQAWFKTSPLSPDLIHSTMMDHKRDRTEKGHFKAPCAGSYFKNNRSFGSPTGVLIDKIGLKGQRLGGAQVAPWHGNIIINEDRATAQDIRNLGNLVKTRVKTLWGFDLEEEVIFLGKWDDNP
ncbi:MAG: UDP-N-acetylenolpyruvoylglucosamine reductase [Spirochaetes bacterium GWB1_48_6]|nr:MAG: UDP-N-acetylenolpyruvoylglucosamine reductase [Spirochaetes bacterium GWB1_48_6]